MTSIKIQIPDNKFVAIMGMKHGKGDKIIIADSYEELWDETTHKDMISMIHYRDKKSNPIDLTCIVCGKDLLPPKVDGGVWLCPDNNCDSHEGDTDEDKN